MSAAVTDAARAPADVDTSAQKAIVATFADSLAATIAKLATELADGTRNVAEALDIAQRRALALAEEVSDADMDLQRKALKAQSLKYQFKVSRVRCRAAC